MACDTREDTDLTSPRTTVDHRPLGNPWMPILSTEKLSTYPRESTEKYVYENGMLGVRLSSSGFPRADGTKAEACLTGRYAMVGSCFELVRQP